MAQECLGNAVRVELNEMPVPRLHSIACGAVVVLAAARAGAFRPGPTSLPGLVGGGELEQVCGKNDLTDVDTYILSQKVGWKALRAAERSTVLIRWQNAFVNRASATWYPGNVAGRNWCTGTLVGDGLVLTAGHCLYIHDGTEQDGRGHIDEIRTPSEVDSSGRVTFLAPDLLAPLLEVEIKSGSGGSVVMPILSLKEIGIWQQAIDGTPVDYAILEIGARNEDTETSLSIMHEGLGREMQVSIIQYPDGLPKRVADGKVLGMASGIYFEHNVDTLAGSSGAGVLNSDGRLVGIHTNGGCATMGRANSGVSLAAIFDVSPIVQAIVNRRTQD